MDEQAAMFILRKVVAHFISIVTEQAKTLPDDNGMCTYVGEIDQAASYATAMNALCNPIFINLGYSQPYKSVAALFLCCGLDVGGREAK